MSITEWEALGGLAKGILLLTFFAWVTCSSFLSLNFQPSLIRLLEGYWSINSLLNWRRRVYQKRWDQLDRQDLALEEQINLLESEKEEYERIQNSLMTSFAEWSDLVSAEDSALNNMSKATADWDAFLNRLKAELKELKSNGNDWPRRLSQSLKRSGKQLKSVLISIKNFFGLSEVAAPADQATLPQRIKKLTELGEQIRDKWLKYQPILEKGRDGKNEECIKCSKQIADTIEHLKQIVSSEIDEIDLERQRLNREQFLFYPSRRADVMPTRLGNTFKAIEMYPKERYNIDTIIIWPRLLPALPKEFNEDLQGSETSFVLMVTISIFSVLFGLPLATYLAVKSVMAVPWWISTILAIIALLLRYPLSVILAVIALLLPMSAAIASYPEGLMTQLQLLSALVASILIISWLSYRNALEASLVYGEKLKSAFDLYRWKVLEALHLELPTGFEREKAIWGEVNGFLYRGNKPDERYFVFARQVNIQDSGLVAQKTVRLPVLMNDHPAFLPITVNDLTEKEIPEAHLPLGVSRIDRNIIGKCPLKAIPAGEVIVDSFLVDPSRIADTVAIGIRATPDMAMGGTLRAGDLVDILMNCAEDTTLTAFEDILILDVRANVDSHVSNDKLPDYSFVIVIALPANKRDSFAAMNYDRRLVLTRKIMTGV